MCVCVYVSVRSLSITSVDVYSFEWKGAKIYVWQMLLFLFFLFVGGHTKSHAPVVFSVGQEILLASFFIGRLGGRNVCFFLIGSVPYRIHLWICFHSIWPMTIYRKKSMLYHTHTHTQSNLHSHLLWSFYMCTFYHFCFLLQTIWLGNETIEKQQKS